MQSSRFIDRSNLRANAAEWSAAAAGGMVVSAHYLASDAGAEVLRAGGNAFDAAIAVSLALSVCESAGSGVGGMGMMIGYDTVASRVFGIAGPCRAPQGASPAAIRNRDRYRGYPAAATPGLCALLNQLANRYGSLPREVIFAPALDCARNGFVVTALQSSLMSKYRNALVRGNAAELFLTAGQPPAPGDVLKQPLLAQTLMQLRDSGFDDFYDGDIAREICRDMRDQGGFVAQTDLAKARRIEEVECISHGFDGGRAFTLGPPAGGISLLQLLALGDALRDDELQLDTAAGVVRTARLIQRVRLDRTRYRLKIRAESPGSALEILDEGAVDAAVDALRRSDTGNGETSHFCVADRAGNWVSMTQSIERCFGAGVATPALGFLYNGYLRAFKIENTRHPYYLRPGVAARSNAAPTIVLRDGKPCLAIGSTGSERMQSGIFEVLLRLRNGAPFDAVQAPRLHASPDGTVMIEAARFPQAVLSALENAGFKISAQDPYAFSMGGLQLLVEDNGIFRGVSEPRRDGTAVGVD